MLKAFVRNRARPEGCIAECYLAEECTRFCSEYTKQAAEIGERVGRNQDIACDEPIEGRPISAGKAIDLDNETINIAHRYVLFNTDEVQPYIE